MKLKAFCVTQNETPNMAKFSVSTNKLSHCFAEHATTSMLCNVHIGLCWAPAITGASSILAMKLHPVNTLMIFNKSYLVSLVTTQHI